MKAFKSIALLGLSALSPALFAGDEPVSSYLAVPEVAELLAVQVAEAEAFPDFKVPANPVSLANSTAVFAATELPDFKVQGDPVLLANSTPLPVAADVPVIGDPVTLAQNVQAPAIASTGEAGDPVTLAGKVEVPSIATLTEAVPPDLFTIDLLFNWGKPHGQWMNQLLKDIEAARKAGDKEAYKKLTERYSVWAEKYLRRDEGPKANGLRGH